MDLKYIVLDGKTPSEKLSDGGNPWSEVKDFENIGLLVPEPFIVLDFDTESDSNIMLRIAEELDLPCRIMKTTRGYHFWFRSPEPWKNFKKTRLAIGIYSDCRSYGKYSYVKVKDSGQLREWVKLIPADEIGEVPSWLRPLSFSKYSFKGMKSGDGRNQDLFEYVLVMQSKGYSREQIRKTIRIINDFVFDEPLPDAEISTILRDESFKSDEEMQSSVESASYFDEDGKFKHNIFAHALVENLNVVTVNEQLYVYDDGYYQRSDRSIEKKMIALYPTIRRAQRTEVLDYMKILTNVKTGDIICNEYIINLSNTRLDLKTGKALPFDPNVIEFSRVPVAYDPDAYCADLDKTLNKVFKGDREVIDLFEEMVGYSLMKNCRFRKGFLFYGGGSNGKSTILNLLKKFIGEENCSTIEMEKLSDRFKTAELENKLLNIGDDINRRDIMDTGTIKKLFTGESVTVERKGQDPFTLKNYAKMIFSCNEIPRIADKTHGMYSRLMLIPFTARFSADDADFDPFIEEKITTPEALSYLLNIGLRGLRRLVHNNEFTYPAVAKEALENYKMDNSTVLTWIVEESISTDTLLNNTTDKLFSDFKDWCNRSEIKFGASIRTFHKEIEEKFGFERIRKRTTANQREYPNQLSWIFVVKLD